MPDQKNPAPWRIPIESCRGAHIGALVACTLLACAGRMAAAQEVKRAELYSPSVGRTLSYNIALPSDYDAGTRRYPVLYMLHGWSGNYTQWNRFGAPQRAKDLPLIIVMPDGGNSWFINWARSDGEQKNAWESYIARDLVTHIDATYRTIAARSGRAIGGVSMGGFGAMIIGLHNPDLFCSIGSHSGALAFAKNSVDVVARGESMRLKTPPDATPSQHVTTPGFSSQAERTLLADPLVTAADCLRNDPYNLVLDVPRDRLPSLFLDCGIDDPFLPQTRELVDILLQHNIPFTYSESSGKHESSYWRREFDLALAVQFAAIQRHLSDAARAQRLGANVQ